MFFSKEQIEQSIKRLNRLNPFFGTVFLAFKKAELPVKIAKNLDFSQIVEDFLRMYYRPNFESSEFYIPFHQVSNKSKSRRWYTKRYIKSLKTTTENDFSDIFIHAKGSTEWGWEPNYVSVLKEKSLSSGLIPAFDLAVWLYRTRSWDDHIQSSKVVETLFIEFNIDKEAQILFDPSIPKLAKHWQQVDKVSEKILLDIIGRPDSAPVTQQRFPGNSLFPNDSLFPSNSLEVGATLKYLKLIGVGPAEQIELEFSQRLNIITGDNGLGKTFLLECAWWALTRDWAGDYQAYPRRDISRHSPSISFRIGNKSPGEKATINYSWERQRWVTPTDRSVLSGLIIYVRLDGSFIVWDPAKFLLTREDPLYAGRGSEAFTHFTRTDVLDGVREGNQQGILRVPCEGLIHDWVHWQEVKGKRFDQFSNVLKALSPHPTEEPLIPGEPIRVTPLDTRMIPTLKFPYGEVPITLCSAGIQRIVALAYLLIWAWDEHVVTSELIRKTPQPNIVLLVDEMESHLHPLWQRTIVPAVIDVVQSLSNEVQIQMIVATHSPLVLASIEPLFDEEKDKLFHLHEESGSVHLNELPFVKRGRVDKWLMSDVFGLAHPRSKDAEEAIEEAKALQRERTPAKEKVQAVSDKLIDVLAQDDEFWPRWTYFAEQRGASL